MKKEGAEEKAEETVIVSSLLPQFVLRKSIKQPKVVK